MPKIVRRWMFLMPLAMILFCVGMGAWTVYTDPWTYVSEWGFFWQCILLALPHIALVWYWLAVRGDEDA